jgi:hypothetical protein
MLAVSTMNIPSSSFVFSSSLLLQGNSTVRVPLQLLEFTLLTHEDVAALISGAFSFNQIICRRLGGSSFNKCSFSRLIYNAEADEAVNFSCDGADVNKKSNLNTTYHVIAWLVTNAIVFNNGKHIIRKRMLHLFINQVIEQ